MEDSVDISQEIKQRLEAYCSKSNRPFDSVLLEAVRFFRIEKAQGGGCSERFSR